MLKNCISILYYPKEITKINKNASKYHTPWTVCSSIYTQTPKALYCYVNIIYPLNLSCNELQCIGKHHATIVSLLIEGPLHWNVKKRLLLRCKKLIMFMLIWWFLKVYRTNTIVMQILKYFQKWIIGQSKRKRRNRRCRLLRRKGKKCRKSKKKNKIDNSIRKRNKKNRRKNKKNKNR